MKATDLSKVWGAPDNSRLTRKQQSFRLPVDVAAKLEALCELYPQRTKTEIVGDLLRVAIEEAYLGLPAEPGEQVDEDSEHGAICEETGPRSQFRALANKHFRELEKELGNKNPEELYTARYTISER